MPSAWRWTVTNPHGHTISCSEERWQHVVSRRPYMAGYEEVVKAAARSPNAIYLDPLRTADTYRPDAWVTSYVAVDRLAAEHAGKLINVVIRWEPHTTAPPAGYVITAYPSRRVSGRLELLEEFHHDY